VKSGQERGQRLHQSEGCRKPEARAWSSRCRAALEEARDASGQQIQRKGNIHTCFTKRAKTFLNLVTTYVKHKQAGLVTE